LNADGTLDTTFNPGAGVSSDGFSLVHSVAVDHDGSIIIGGLFTRVGGVSRPYLARLETDGTLDRTFTPAVDAAVRMLAFNSLGRLVVGGEFARVNGKPNSRIGRLGAPADSGFLAPGFSNLRREASGCYVTFRGPTEARSRVQCSTNLVDWVDCLEVGAGAAVRLSETNNPDCGGKFFRAVVQPTVLSQVPAAAR
ncbi:MAG TPA: delta-60 repeat domain-containing protein, partial [Candidatus Sulfotelmatobacter sp.]|nr:delta-60 repeat domain-containing protein [Candidatus Sulfotelmatobacter sp.]